MYKRPFHVDLIDNLHNYSLLALIASIVFMLMSKAGDTFSYLAAGFFITFLVMLAIHKIFEEPKGINRSWDFNRHYGRFYIKYHDNQVSQPMCRDTAESYARMFSGSEICEVKSGHKDTENRVGIANGLE